MGCLFLLSLAVYTTHCVILVSVGGQPPKLMGRRLSQNFANSWFLLSRASFVKSAPVVQIPSGLYIPRTGYSISHTGYINPALDIIYSVRDLYLVQDLYIRSGICYYQCGICYIQSGVCIIQKGLRELLAGVNVY